MKIPFTNLFTDCTKLGTKINTDQYCLQGKNIIIDQGKNEIAGYTDMETGLFKDVPAIIFGDHTRIIKFVNKPFFLGADGVKVLKCIEKNSNYKYFYYALSNIVIPDTGYNRHFKWLKETYIEVHKKEQQKMIVAVLDKVTNLLKTHRRQLQLLNDLIKSRFIEMFGNPNENPFKWDKRPLSSITLKANNGMARRGHDIEGNIVLRLVELQDGYIDYSNTNRIILSEKEKERFELKEKDFLFARVNGNPQYVGRCAVFHKINEPVYHNDHINYIFLHLSIY